MSDSNRTVGPADVTRYWNAHLGAARDLRTAVREERAAGSSPRVVHRPRGVLWAMDGDQLSAHMDRSVDRARRRPSVWLGVVAGIALATAPAVAFIATGTALAVAVPALAVAVVVALKDPEVREIMRTGREVGRRNRLSAQDSMIEEMERESEGRLAKAGLDLHGDGSIVGLEHRRDRTLRVFDEAVASWRGTDVRELSSRERSAAVVAAADETLAERAAAEDTLAITPQGSQRGASPADDGGGWLIP